MLISFRIWFCELLFDDDEYEWSNNFLWKEVCIRLMREILCEQVIASDCEYQSLIVYKRILIAGSSLVLFAYTEPVNDIMANLLIQINIRSLRGEGNTIINQEYFIIQIMKSGYM